MGGRSSLGSIGVAPPIGDASRRSATSFPQVDAPGGSEGIEISATAVPRGVAGNVSEFETVMAVGGTTGPNLAGEPALVVSQPGALPATTGATQCRAVSTRFGRIR